MHYTIAGNGSARKPLIAIADELRLGGAEVDRYFNDHLYFIRERIPESDALILGLSEGSRNPKSNEFEAEYKLLSRALKGGKLVGIVCDAQGHVSAPYLVEFGSGIGFVVAREQSPGCGLGELCERAHLIFAPDLRLSAPEIDRFVRANARPRLRMCV